MVIKTYSYNFCWHSSSWDVSSHIQCAHTGRGVVGGVKQFTWRRNNTTLSCTRINSRKLATDGSPSPCNTLPISCGHPLLWNLWLTLVCAPPFYMLWIILKGDTIEFGVVKGNIKGESIHIVTCTRLCRYHYHTPPYIFDALCIKFTPFLFRVCINFATLEVTSPVKTQQLQCIRHCGAHNALLLLRTSSRYALFPSY